MFWLFLSKNQTETAKPKNKQVTYRFLAILC